LTLLSRAARNVGYSRISLLCTSCSTRRLPRFCARSPMCAKVSRTAGSAHVLTSHRSSWKWLPKVKSLRRGSGRLAGMSSRMLHDVALIARGRPEFQEHGSEELVEARPAAPEWIQASLVWEATAAIVAPAPFFRCGDPRTGPSGGAVTANVARGARKARANAS